MMAMIPCARYTIGLVRAYHDIVFGEVDPGGSMDRWNGTAAVLATFVLATVQSNVWAHEQKPDQRAHVPNVIIVPPANALSTSPPYPPVWIPGTIPGQPPQVWFPAMPPASNMDHINPGGVLSGPPPNSPPHTSPHTSPNIGNIAPHRETLPGDLSREERESLRLACGDPRATGVAAYRQCVTGQINVLRSAGRRPNLDTLSPSERSSVEQACVDAKRQGPAVYNRCRAIQAQGMNH